MKIHHIGIVVSDLDKALKTFGFKVDDLSETVEDPEQKNTLYFCYDEDNHLWLEFIEPWDETSTTSVFAKKFGNGIHHLGYITDDIKCAEKELRSTSGNFFLGCYRIHVKSFGGDIQTLFFSSNGIIMEFVCHKPKHVAYAISDQNNS